MSPAVALTIVWHLLKGTLHTAAALMCRLGAYRFGSYRIGVLPEARPPRSRGTENGVVCKPVRRQPHIKIRLYANTTVSLQPHGETEEA